MHTSAPVTHGPTPVLTRRAHETWADLTFPQKRLSLLWGYRVRNKPRWFKPPSAVAFSFLARLARAFSYVVVPAKFKLAR